MEEEEKVIAALENSKYQWRTVSGIAKETKLADSKIWEIIDKHRTKGDIVRSSVPDAKGNTLFATRKHYAMKASVFSRFISSTAGIIK